MVKVGNEATLPDCHSLHTIDAAFYVVPSYKTIQMITVGLVPT